MKKVIFTGAASAIITPLNESGIDFDAFGRYIDWQIENVQIRIENVVYKYIDKYAGQLYHLGVPKKEHLFCCLKAQNRLPA